MPRISLFPCMPQISMTQFGCRPGIGGCNDGPGLLTLQRNGELEPLLKSAGAL